MEVQQVEWKMIGHNVLSCRLQFPFHVYTVCKDICSSCTAFVKVDGVALLNFYISTGCLFGKTLEMQKLNYVTQPTQHMGGCCVICS